MKLIVWEAKAGKQTSTESKPPVNPSQAPVCPEAPGLHRCHLARQDLCILVTEQCTFSRPNQACLIRSFNKPNGVQRYEFLITE